MAQNTIDVACPGEPGPNDEHVSSNEDLPYGDCKRSTEFTSEKFKLEVSNLPHNVKFHIAKQMLAKHYKLKPHKIRLGRGVVYLAFNTEQDRDDALAKIDNTYWKGRTLAAKTATARHDPHVIDERRDRVAHSIEEAEDANINTKICPLWQKPYEQQLIIKERLMRSALNFNKQILRMCPQLKKDAPQLHSWCLQNEKHPFPFEGVERSPVIHGYRNKCEFNVGADGVIGFRLGCYKDGSCKVVPPADDCPVVNDKMRQVIKTFQEFLNDKSKTKLIGFNQLTHEGHISQLTVRTTQRDECMVIVHLHCQTLTEAELDVEAHTIVDVLSANNLVHSIYMSLLQKNHSSGSEDTLKLIHNVPYLSERLCIEPNLELTFRIGPLSFFQVNTKAAEVLYKTIIEIAQLNANSLVLDVGCGTGTIALSVARRVRHVIGIEILSSAIEDAKVNAAENKVENVTFVCGKAEDLINESILVLKNMQNEDKKDEAGDTKSEDIVAIVDPPRAGFNSSFVKSLRASNIDKIVYVACDAKANENLVSLCRPTSKAYRGEPLVPVRAKAVDLFPHTKCCELVILYQRLRPPLSDAAKDAQNEA